MNAVDTVILFASAGRRKHSFKRLAGCLLNKEIQAKSSPGHCSDEGAVTSLMLAVPRTRLGNTFNIQDNGGQNGSDEETF